MAVSRVDRFHHGEFVPHYVVAKGRLSGVWYLVCHTGPLDWHTLAACLSYREAIEAMDELEDERQCREQQPEGDEVDARPDVGAEGRDGEADAGQDPEQKIDSESHTVHPTQDCGDSYGSALSRLVDRVKLENKRRPNVESSLLAWGQHLLEQGR